MASAGVVPTIAGFDIGSENCYIGVAKGGGIEIILNDYSQRSTPAYVALGDRQRELGVAAKQKQLMNIRSTFYSLIRLIGRQFNDVQSTEKLPFPIEVGEHGDVVVPVVHNGEEHKFTVTQLLAMLLTKLRQTADNCIDCVINCPSYFTDSQRRALVDAAMIAGLNPLRILPDLTAIGIYYGFYRAHSSPDINVAFVDCGNSTTQVAVVQFKNLNGTGTMNVLSLEYDSNLGGRNFDEVLAQYFITNHKLTLNKRAELRLLAECEKLKKQMSANSNKLPINIECLYEDRDFTSSMDRTIFEELAAPYLQKLEVTFKKALEKAHERYLLYQKNEEKPQDFKIDAVELVGGSSRVAAIRRIAKQIFGQEPTSTLNADEAVARGCALQCALLSPTRKGREFIVSDFAPYAVSCKYWFEGHGEGKIHELKDIFSRGHQYPFTRKITLSCSSLPLVFELEYTNDHNHVVPIGQYKVSSIENVVLQKSKLTLLVRLDGSGIANLIGASVIIEDKQAVNGQSAVPEGTQEGETPDANKETKAKTVTVQLSVEPQWIKGKLSESELELQREVESNLILADKNWKERIDARNELEEYVYEWRGKLEDGRYDQFVEAGVKESFLRDLNSMQAWLYEDEESGETQSKGVYVERLNQLRTSYSNQIVFRTREFEERESYLERLGGTIQMAQKLAQSLTEVETVHGINLDEKKVSKLQTELAEKVKWFDEAHSYFKGLLSTQDPQITTKDIRERIDQLESARRPVSDEIQRKLDEKKRKAEEEAKKAESENQQQQQQHQQQQQQPGQQPQQQKEATATNTNPSEPMDVDSF